MSEEKTRESVKTNLAAAINEAREVMQISADLGVAIRDLAAKYRAPPSKMALACIMSGYSLLQFTLPPWQVDPKFYEAVKLAKEMWEVTRPSTKQEKEKAPDEADP